MKPSIKKIKIHLILAMKIFINLNLLFFLISCDGYSRKKTNDVNIKNSDSSISIIDETPKEDEKTNLKITGTPFNKLIEKQDRSSLISGSIKNLSIINGFRGLKLGMCIDSIYFDPSTWKYETSYENILYTHVSGTTDVNFNNSECSITFRLTFLNGELVRIYMHSERGFIKSLMTIYGKPNVKNEFIEYKEPKLEDGKCSLLDNPIKPTFVDIEGMDVISEKKYDQMYGDNIKIINKPHSVRAVAIWRYKSIQLTYISIGNITIKDIYRIKKEEQKKEKERKNSRMNDF